MVNTGTNERPALAEASLVEADGEPIRILREEVLGAPGHRHNMGYTYPEYVDWDADGLPDLMVPNETNRIFWYRNTHPVFDIFSVDIGVNPDIFHACLILRTMGASLDVVHYCAFSNHTTNS